MKQRFLWHRYFDILMTISSTIFILNYDLGHLLVLQAELNNTGNYSCIAANIVRQRISDPALLTVYSKFIIIS